MKLKFWFEFASTYSYPAAMRIENLAQQNDIELEWCPFLLGPIFKSQGWSDSPFNLYPAKGNYMWRDLERICQTQDLILKRPSVFPRNGLLAARVACQFSAKDWLPEFVRSVYKANFEYDLDISEREVVANCLPLSMAESKLILEEAESQTSKELLKASTEKAQKMGIFGAPSFTVGSELFWGNDRLETAINWLLNNCVANP